MHLRSTLDSETLNALLESFSCPALILDTGRRVRAANEAFREAVGPEREVIGSACFEVFHGRRKPCGGRHQICPLDACVRTGTVVPAIHSHPAGVGDRILLRPIHDDDGAIVACLATLRGGTRARHRATPVFAGHERVALAPVAGQITRLGRSRLPVLIVGEPGTGRSIAARSLHRQKPSPGLYEEESALELTQEGLRMLWTRGRAQEGGGTLHLRDVHGLGRRAQSILVDLLSADAGRRRRWRLVSSTDRDLRALVADGLFREDLRVGLAARRLRLPPLRERWSELPEIARALLGDVGGQASVLTEAAFERLRSHPFPGNLDELEQVLRHASFVAPGGTVDVAHLPDWLVSAG
jgi:two-component system, NtrC family, response regulator HydG